MIIMMGDDKGKGSDNGKGDTNDDNATKTINQESNQVEQPCAPPTILTTPWQHSNNSPAML